MKHADVTGTWKVSITATGGTQVPSGAQWTAIINTKQHEGKISGTFVTEHGLTGEITGQVIGSQVSMTIEQGPIRPGTFQGVSTINASNNKMTGSYSGGDSGGTLEATVTAYKMKYYEVVISKIKTKLCSSDPEDELGIPLWGALLFGLGAISVVAIFLLAYAFFMPFMEKIIPHFKAYFYLVVILMFSLYGLYKHFKGE